MFTRAWRADFNVADSEGRIISGIAVPYDSPTTINERGRTFSETWKAGSTRGSIAKRGKNVKLLGFHDQRAFPLGKPTLLDDRADGMYMEARISDTTDGRDALTLVRDGVLDGFSVGFSVPAGGDTWSKDESQRTITRAEIHEVSIVNFPAFDRARIEAIRSTERADPMSHAFEDDNGDGFCDLCGAGKDQHAAHMVNTDGNENAAHLAVVHRLELLRLDLLKRRISA